METPAQLKLERLTDVRILLVNRKLEIQNRFAEVNQELAETMPYKRYRRIVAERNALRHELGGIDLRLSGIKADLQSLHLQLTPQKTSTRKGWLTRLINKAIQRKTKANAHH